MNFVARVRKGVMVTEGVFPYVTFDDVGRPHQEKL